jgi:hypothetical protein
MKRRKSKELDLLAAINGVADEVNRVLNDEKEEHYFYLLLLLYSFVENILKHICFIDALRKQFFGLGGDLHPDIIEILAEKYIDATFDQAIKNASKGKLKRSKELLKSLGDLKRKRNNFIHQLWLHEQARSNPKLLRRELEEAAYIANALVARINRMQKEIGVLDLYYPTDWLKEKHYSEIKC